MVVGWAPWWTGQTERTTLLTVGEARIEARTSKAIEAATRDSLRVMLSAIALTIAIALGAQHKGSDGPLLVKGHTMRSVLGAREAHASGGGGAG